MLELLFGAAQETVRSTLAIIGLFFVIPGLIQCFFGYRVLKLFAAFMGFLVGVTAFGIIGVVTTEALGPGLLMGLIGGLLLALLAFKAYKIAVCLINGINVFLATVTFGFFYGLEQAVRYFDQDYLMRNLAAGGMLGIILAVLAILLTALLFRPLIILSSALEGGLLLGGGLCMMLYTLDMTFPVSLLCIVAGAAFQFYNTREEALSLKQERKEKAQRTQQTQGTPKQGKFIRASKGFYAGLIAAELLVLYVWNKWDTAGMILSFIAVTFFARGYSYFLLKRNYPQQMAGVSFLCYMANPFRQYVNPSE